MNTFSDRMIQKYGADKWADMMTKTAQQKDMVIISGADLLNHSFISLVMTGNSYDGALDKIKGSV